MSTLQRPVRVAPLWRAAICSATLATIAAFGVQMARSGRASDTANSVSASATARPRPQATHELGQQLPFLPQSVSDPRTVIVYVTQTGKKYHRDGCQHLRKSKISMPLSQADNIYEPCAHCRPPTLNANDSDTTNVAVSQHRGSQD